MSAGIQMVLVSRLDPLVIALELRRCPASLFGALLGVVHADPLALVACFADTRGGGMLVKHLWLGARGVEGLC